MKSVGRDDPRPAPAGERRQPGALELARWAAAMVGASLVVAGIAIPILLWLGLGPE